MTEFSKTVVVTGGEGFVGKHLQAELRGAWPQVKVVSFDLPGVDITKPETYRERLSDLRPDWVVHLAAIASVPQAAKQPELVEAVNVRGTQQLLQTVRTASPQTRILVASSADVYGRAAEVFAGSPLPELPLSDCQPTNPYAQSKWDMERIVEHDFQDMTVRVRPFPHAGPGQALGFVTADFASQVAAIESGQQEAIMKVGNLASERDFTDVRDVVRAYRLLMEQEDGLGQVFNVASGRSIKIQAILDSLLAMSDMDIVVEQDPERMRPSDVPRIVGDASALRQLTGWQPEIRFKQTLRDVLDYWRVRTS